MIAFYGVPGGRDQFTRIAAVAQHIADPTMVYTLGESVDSVPLDWHGVDWYSVSCGSPNCGGVSPQQFAKIVESDAPKVMVMDSAPYGAMAGELRAWLKARPASRNFFIASRNPFVERTGFDEFDFAQVFKTEGGSYPGVDAPVFAFDPEHILSREDARAELNLRDRPTVFIVRSPSTQPNIAEVARRLCAQRGVDVIEWAGYPLMPYLMAADLVVGMAGLLACEVQAVGVPAQLAAANASPVQQARANATPSSLHATISSIQFAADHPVSFRNDARAVALAIAGERGLQDPSIPMPPPIVGVDHG